MLHTRSISCRSRRRECGPRRSLLLLRLEQDLAELIHLRLVVDLALVQLDLQILQHGRVRDLGHRGHLVVGLERVSNGVPVVDEVEDEGLFLLPVLAIEPGQGLHRVDPLESLVHVHRVKQGLIEAGLVLLGHYQHPVFLGVELLRELLLLEPLVHLHLGVLDAGDLLVDDLSREGHQGLHVGVALLLDVLVERQLVPDRVEPRARDHHRLRLAVDAVAGVMAEMLHDHLGLLGDVVRVQRHEPGQRRRRLLLLHLGVVLDRLYQPVVGLVGGVVLQHV